MSDSDVLDRVTGMLVRSGWLWRRIGQPVSLEDSAGGMVFAVGYQGGEPRSRIDVVRAILTLLALAGERPDRGQPEDLYLLYTASGPGQAGVFSPRTRAWLGKCRLFRRRVRFMRVATGVEPAAGDMDTVDTGDIADAVNHLRAGGWVLTFPHTPGMATGAVVKVESWPWRLAQQAGVRVWPLHLRTRWGIGWSVISGRPRLVAGDLFLVDALRDAAMADEDWWRDWLWSVLYRPYPVPGRQTVTRSVVEDATGAVATLPQLRRRARMLAQVLAPDLVGTAPVGVLLPTSFGAVVTFFALQSMGRVVAMLNFTAGPQGVEQACRLARITTVITSRQFVAKARLQGMVEHLAPVVTVRFLEDLRGQVGLRHLLSAWWDDLLSCLSPAMSRRTWVGPRTPDDAAVILFTSGSEGVPKGVVLSHASLLANVRQAALCLDLRADDRFLNVLPMFHAFGLTLGTLAPLCLGMRLYLLPSPLESRTVAATAYTWGATLLAGTNTFLSQYGRVAGPGDFYRMRYVFAGAEPLREETRRLWQERFGLRILEGYGTTETSPVLAVNTPAACRPGTVGRGMPGMVYRLEPVTGLVAGGRLHVRGPNVMLGYIGPDGTWPLGVRDGSTDVGEYDTGDIASIDEDGFITLLGRVRRFAKIGGEMVSLAAVEQAAATLWPEYAHAATTTVDPVRGEQVVLVSECPAATRQDLTRYLREQGMSDLSAPRRIEHVAALPHLGSGKVDYPALARLLAAGNGRPGTEVEA